MFLNILLTIVAILTLYLLNNKHFFSKDILKDYGNNPKVPFLKTGFLLALLSPHDLFNIIRKLARSYNNKSIRGKVFTKEVFAIYKAKDAEILLSMTKDAHKGSFYHIIEPFIKSGLITSNGKKWAERRRLLTPTFHFNILKEYFEIFLEEGDRLLDLLKESNGKAIDISPIAATFSLNSVCEAAMGIKLSNLGNDGVVYCTNVHLVGEKIVFRMFKPWLHINLIYRLWGYLKELKLLLKPIQDFTQAIIKKRRIEFLEKKNSEMNNEEVEVDESENVYMRSKKKRYAMMDTLLQAQSEGLIDDEGIIEETDTFAFAGHDTTSAAMTFTLLLLAHHPEVQEKLLSEINELTSEDQQLSTTNFNKMHYMEQVLKESMRLYPPVPFIGRKLINDLTCNDVTYPKGTDVFIFIYDIHRDPEIFPDPEKFDPDRFLPDECAKRSNYAHIPFSAGIRNCIGQKFAMLELKVMLTKVIQNFNIHPVTKIEDLVFVTDMILRTNHPIDIKFIPRQK